MTTKIQELIQLKKNIDTLSNSFRFNMDFKYDNLIVDLNKEGWTDTNELIKNSKMKGIPVYDGDEGYTVVKFIGPKGGVVERHKHTHDELLICLKGSFRYVKNDNEHAIINPLESVLIKKNINHHVELLEDSEILTVWTPSY